MGTTSQILIEVDDSGAISAFRAINAEGSRLNQNLQPIPEHLNGMTSGTKQAREAAALLSEEFGVKMPRALRGVLAENSLIGPAISAAFSGLAVAGFIEVVKSALD